MFPAVKARRAEQIMLLQQDISAKRNAALIGSEIKVIVDRQENGYWSGRSEFDSPEVDNEVVIDDPKGRLYPGLIAGVKITGADLYDLKAIAT